MTTLQLAGGTLMGKTATDTTLQLNMDRNVWIDTSVKALGASSTPWMTPAPQIASAPVWYSITR